VTGTRGALWIDSVPVVSYDGLAPNVVERLRRRLGARVGAPAEGACIALVGAPDEDADLVRRIGDGDAGLTAGGDLVLFYRGGSVRVRGDGEASTLTLSCTRSLRDVSLIAGLTQIGLLAHGVVPLHAAAAATESGLLAIAGWSGAGKTTAMTALLDHRAKPVAAEWIYLLEDGGPMTADHDLRLRAHHVRRSRSAHSMISPARRAAMLAGSSVTARLDVALARFAGRVAAPRRLVRRLSRRLYTDTPLPRDEEGTARRALAAVAVLVAGDGVSAVEPLEPAGIASRIGAAFEEDLAVVAAAQRRFAFAFGRRAPWGDEWPTQYRDALARRLDGVAVAQVVHSPHAGNEALAALLMSFGR
jgi:hypothetical protein